MSTTAPAVREYNGTTIPAPGTYVIDPAHTRIGFSVKHLVIAKVRGQFDTFEGQITFADDPAESTATVKIDAASINTGDPGRDEHVRTGDFLLADEHPHLTFATTGLSPAGNGRYHLTGDLTIRGITRPVVLDVEFEGSVTDPWGNEKVAFTATTEIDRDDYGVSWNQALDAGGVMVGKKVTIDLEVQATRQP